MNKSEYPNKRLLVFFSLLIALGLVLGAGVLLWKVSDSEARIQESKATQAMAAAQVAEVQPDIIVARSQANINNSVALTNLKDGALLIVMVIMMLKDTVRHERS